MPCLVWGKIILHLHPLIKLTNHSLCSAEDNVVELRNESKEVGVEGNFVFDALVEVFNVVVGLESVAENREPFRPDFSHPKSNDVTLMKDEQLSACRGIQNSPNSGLHPIALDWDFIGRKEAKGKIPPQNGLDAIVIVVVVVSGNTMGYKKMEGKKLFKTSSTVSQIKN